MVIPDIVMLFCLLGFCGTWLIGSSEWTHRWLWFWGLGAGLAAGIDVALGRWQATVGGLVAAGMLVCLVVRGRLRQPGQRPAQQPRQRPAPTTTLVLLVLTAIAVAPLYLIPVFRLPPPTGPYAVGVRDFELTDHNRLGVMEAGATQPRRLPVRVWYPARQPGSRTAPYATDRELSVTFAGIARSLNLPAFVFSHLRLVETHSYRDAELLAGDTPLKVVYFSHGYSSYLAQNTALMETLASHGYLVFAVAHPYDAAPLLFADGSVIAPPAQASSIEVATERGEAIVRAQRNLFAGADYDQRYLGLLDYLTELKALDHRLLRSAEAWLDDRLFVSQALANGQVPERVKDLAARGDFTRVAHLGMSFGGSTAAAAGYADPRCAAAINLDGGDYHLTPLNNPTPVPLLMVHSDWRYFADRWGVPDGNDPSFAFNDFSYERHARAGLDPQVYRLRVKNIRHLGISDLPLLLRPPLRGWLAGSIDADTMLRIVNDFVVGFLDHHLRGINNGFPEQPITDHAEHVDRHDAAEVRRWWREQSAAEKRWLEYRLATITGRGQGSDHSAEPASAD